MFSSSFVFLFLLPILIASEGTTSKDARSVEYPMGNQHVTHVGKTSEVVAKASVFAGKVEDIQWVGKSRDLHRINSLDLTEEYRGYSKRTVLVLTTGHQLYRSTNDGVDWVHVNPTLHGADNEGVDTGVFEIVTAKEDGDRMDVFLQGTGTMNWYSHDGGITFTPVQVGTVAGKKENKHKKAYEIVISHYNPQHLLGAVLSEACNQEDVLEGKPCNRELWGSKDGGKSWKKLAKFVVQYNFVRNHESLSTMSHSEDAIFVTAFHSSRHSSRQSTGYWDPDIHMYVLNDWGDGWFASAETEALNHDNPLIKHGNRFLYGDKYLFCAQVNPQNRQEVVLQISSDAGKTWKPATMPHPLTQHSYTVLDTSEGAVFLHVNHQGEGIHYGNIYLSDARGHHFALSLAGNRRNERGKCDFEKVQGVDGIYLANYVSNTKQLEEDAYRQIEEVMDFGGKREKGEKDLQRMKQLSITRTAITFDKGGNWHHLRPPKLNVHGKDACAEYRKSASAHDDCYLHLHGISSQSGPFYSSKNAVGIIMATGNVGHELSYNSKQVNTYLSRNGGLDWKEVGEGSFIYEFGDHGSLIVMLRDTEPTNTLYYSWDYGEMWYEWQFTESPMMVDNIIADPTSTSQVFLVYGSNQYEDHSGAVVAVDFSHLHTRACRGANVPNSGTSDYEIWTPHDGRTVNDCVLGRVTTFTRRKGNKACWNAEHYETVKEIKHCECGEEDFECEMGYERPKDENGIQIAGAACKPVSNEDGKKQATAELVPDVCPYGTKYRPPSAYRKVAGDSCTGGLLSQRLSPPTYCPVVRSMSNGAFFVLLVLVIVGVVVLYFARKKKENGTGRSKFESYRRRRKMSAAERGESGTWNLQNAPGKLQRMGSNIVEGAGLGSVMGRVSDLVSSGLSLFSGAPRGGDAKQGKYKQISESLDLDNAEETTEPTPALYTASDAAGGMRKRRGSNASNPFSDDLHRKDTDDFVQEMDEDLIKLGSDLATEKDDSFNPRS